MRAGSRRARRSGFASWLGPLLIVGSVLFALRGFIVDGGLTNQHPDLLTFWLPRWSFLGDSVAAGRIPLWNPFEMAGYRFAADPQSGWLSARPRRSSSRCSRRDPPFGSSSSCNPLLAGLGMYAFLRKEDLGRAAATVGGLVLAMMMSTSTIAISLPFAGALAMDGRSPPRRVAGYRRAERWSGRLAWLALGAFAWMQVAAAHMSHGLVIATAFATVYLVAGAVATRGPGVTERRSAAGPGGAVPPRPAARRAADPRAARRLPRRVEPARRLRRARGHGPVRGGRSARLERRLGGVAAGLRRRAGRLRRSGGARVRPPRCSRSPAPDARDLDRRARARRLRAHVPSARERGLVPVPRARDARSATSTSTTPGAFATSPCSPCPSWPRPACKASWIARFPLAPRAPGSAPRRSRSSSGRSSQEADLVRFVMVAARSCWPAAPLLYGIATRRWRWASAPRARRCARRRASRERRLRAVLRRRHDLHRAGDGRSPEPRPPGPSVSHVGRSRLPRDHADRGAHAIGPGRYATWAPPAAYFEKGYLWMKSPADWPALAPTRGTLFEIPDALGYNPVQLPRYWRYIRATNELSVFYNASVLNTPSVEDVRLLGLRYLVVPTGLEPPVEGQVVAEAGCVLPLGARRRTAPGDHERGREARGRHPAGAGARDRAGLRPIDDRDRGTVDRRTPTRRCCPSAWIVDTPSPTEIRIRLDPPAAGVLTVRNAYRARLARDRGRTIGAPRSPSTDSSRACSSLRARERSSSPTTTTR